MKEKLIKIIAFVLFSFASSLSIAANITGDIRGVTLFYLDSEQNDFPYILNNQENVNVKQKINNLLNDYKNSGVNWIRLLIAAQHLDHGRTSPKGYPLTAGDSTTLLNSDIAKVNSLLEKIRLAGGFKVEIVLGTPMGTTPGTSMYGHFLDDANNGFPNDKKWIKHWLNNLNYSIVEKIMIAGDTSPCGIANGSVKCHGEAGVNSLNYNNGLWIKTMWSDLKGPNSTFKNLALSYEVIGGDNVDVIKKSSQWSDANTPGNPIFAVSLYAVLPTGSSWTAYKDRILTLINAYKSVSTKQLWIDEFGFGFCTYPSTSCNHTQADQKAYYDGFLSATTCFSNDKYPKFAWVAGNDFPNPLPSPTVSNQGKKQYGLIASFTGNFANWRPAASPVGLYYNLTSCN